MKKNEIILVTGSNGKIGRFIIPRLVGLGYKIRAATRDNKNIFRNCENLVIGNVNSTTQWHQALLNVHTVIHLAAKKQPFFDFKYFARNVFNTNVLGTENLLDQCIKANVKNFIYFGSCSVYGSYSEIGKAFDVFSKLNPVGAYSKSKCLAEDIIKFKLLKSNCVFKIIRIPHVFFNYSQNNSILIKCVINLTKFISLPIDLKKNKRSIIMPNDLFLALLTSINEKEGCSKIFLVKSSPDISSFDILKKRFNLRNCKFSSYPLFLLNGLKKVPLVKKYTYKLFCNFQIINSSKTKF